MIIINILSIKSGVGKFAYTTLNICFHHALSPMNREIQNAGVSV